MKWVYFIKTLLKSVIIISIVLFVAFSFLQTPNESSSTPRIGQEGPYLTSVEQELGPKGEDLGWSDFEKNVKYHLRFWDLVKSVNSSHVINTQPLFKGNKLDNLWRPLKGMDLDGRESNRLVPQTVWQMEALNTSYAKSFKTKKIVLWDGFEWWHHPTWKDPHIVPQSDCEIAHNSLAKCTFSENTSDLKEVDAVVTARDMFHTGRVEVPDNVMRFFFMLESPFHSWGLLHRSNDLLATYWRGSDIVTPYAKWVYYDLNQKLKKNLVDKDYTVGKSKTAAAFISNCDPWNDRLGFIKELQKHIQVDVYGSCGEFRCARWGSKDCFAMLKKDYYFYMSFENSNCRDYITEKLYTNGLTNNVIPIVMGAHPEDYKAMSPFKSYIHIEEFDSPKELGEYLKHLMENPSEYNKYFGWKGTGEFVSSSFFCQLCAMAHYADIVPPPERRKPFRWGHVQAIDEGMCLPKGQWYWTRTNDGKPLATKKKIISKSNNSSEQKLLDVETLYGYN